MAEAEVIGQLVEVATETISSVGKVVLRKENFKQLGGCLERVVPVLEQLQGSSAPLEGPLTILRTQLDAASVLTRECSTYNRFYLLLNSRAISKRLRDITSEMGRAFSLLPLSSLRLSRSLLSDLDRLVLAVHSPGPHDDLLRNIDSALRANVDAAHANDLLMRIADAVGVPTSIPSLRLELLDFKQQTDSLRLAKRHAEAKQMEQIIALLDRSDIVRTRQDRQADYLSGQHVQPFEAMDSFFCPITGDVMIDPVDTSSGQTYERSAIEKWIADGNSCPITKLPLDASCLRPNKSLSHAIRQWNDLNAKSSISAIRTLLQDNNDATAVPQLLQLKKFCDSDCYREYVLLENHVPVLVHCLGSRSTEVRFHSLGILCVLVKTTQDATDLILEHKDAIGAIVRSLGRKIDEGRIALELLLELCKSSVARDMLGRTQGCFVLLACMSASCEEARNLLELLAYTDTNVVEMARASYFKHLVDRLRTGEEDTKLLMASTLAEIELTDHYKETLFREVIAGVLPPLLELISSGNSQMKAASLKALRNLSTVPFISIEMIKARAVAPLLNVLYRHTSVPSAREHVSVTVMNLALATSLQAEDPISLLESEEDIIKLLNLIPLVGSDVQLFVLRAFIALCQSPSASEIKKTLEESPVMQMLFPLLRQESRSVRKSAILLLSCIIKGCKEEMLNQEATTCIEQLLRIVKDSTDEDEIASALAILSDFPENPEIERSLVDAGGIPLILQIITRNVEKSVYITENSAGVLRRLTSPDNVAWQKQIAKSGAIPLLVKLLETGTYQTKIHVSKCLERLSKSSARLSALVMNQKQLSHFLKPVRRCAVHGGKCSVKDTFCLVEARAVEPLIRALEDSKEEVRSASMDALLTLIEGERLQAGVKCLANTAVIPVLIKFLSSSRTDLVEKSLNALERIFRIPEPKILYGKMAETILVELTVRGSSSTKPLAGKILGRLNVLQEVSSFF